MSRAPSPFGGRKRQYDGDDSNGYGASAGRGGYMGGRGDTRPMRGRGGYGFNDRGRGRGGFSGRGRVGGGRGYVPDEVKRQRMMEMSEGFESGREGGLRGPRPPPSGPSMMSGGMGAAPRGRPPFGGPRPGFLHRGGHNAGPFGRGHEQSKEFNNLMGMIVNAVTPQAVLALWMDTTQSWAEMHLGAGLLKFAQLVEEVAPDDLQELKRHQAFGNMITAAKSHMSTMKPADRSKVSRAMGKLQYQDEDLCMALVQWMRHDLHDSAPIAVAGIMAGLGMVAYRPETEALTAVEQYVVNHASVLTPKDVKDFLVAFASMEWQPQAPVINSAIMHLPARFSATSPRDLSQLISALSKIQFTPPPPFVQPCTLYLVKRLEGFMQGAQAQATAALDAGVVIRFLTSLVAFKVDPPARLLELVCSSVVRLIESAEASDICDLLEVCADLYWHPGEEFLGQAQTRLTAAATDMALVSLCTSLWAYATFAYVPAIDMQKAYANRIEAELEQLRPYQLCSLLWVYALFRTCTQGVWNTLATKLAQFELREIDNAALKFFYQVYILLNNSSQSLQSYNMPERLIAHAQTTWQQAKADETRAAMSDFEKDVLRILSQLNISNVEHKVTIEDGLFAVDLWLPTHFLAIMCLPKNRFTVNAVAVHGPHGMMRAPQPLGQTKMMQNLFRICQVPVFMVPQHIWYDLKTDEYKQDFLKRQIQKNGNASGGEAALL